MSESPSLDVQGWQGLGASAWNGFCAAVIGSTILVTRCCDPSMSLWFLVSGVGLFAAGFVAARDTEQSVPKIWLAVLGGAAAGIAAHAIVHATFLGGSRNLWPFEVVIFLFCGFVPAILGVLLGRRHG